jgi:hypothetical protein
MHRRVKCFDGGGFTLAGTDNSLSRGPGLPAGLRIRSMVEEGFVASGLCDILTRKERPATWRAFATLLPHFRL